MPDMPDCTVNVTDAFPKHGEIHATVAVKGLWRVQAAAVLIRLAGLVLGSELALKFPEADRPEAPDGSARADIEFARTPTI